jgi:hypothetical protein
LTTVLAPFSPDSHSRLEPFLFRVLFLEEPLPKLTSAIDAKPIEFLRGAVRHVYLNAGRSEWPTKLLRTCTGTIDLLIVDNTFDLDLVPILAQMRLQRLTLYIPGVGQPIPFTHALFRSVTHLGLYTGHQRGSGADSYLNLRSLPALTHIWFPTRIGRVILPHLIEGCPKLLVIVVFIAVPAKQSYVETLSDPRIVLRVLDSSFSADWKVGARGGEDFWVRAEKFIAGKRKGEIEGMSFPCDSSCARY